MTLETIEPGAASHARRAIHSSTTSAESVDRLRRRQRSLMNQYRHEPTAAQVVDAARTHADNPLAEGPLDPLHTWVEVGTRHRVHLAVAVHQAVGGLSDLPVPGDILCAALASCSDSSLRVVANALEVELQTLHVEAKGRWTFAERSSSRPTYPSDSSASS